MIVLKNENELVSFTLLLKFPNSQHSLEEQHHTASLQPTHSHDHECSIM